MAVKRYKPTSPARRNMSVSDFAEITSTKPEKSLLVSLNKTGGRNSTGRITVRHIGGGNRTKYRIIDYKRNKDGIPAKVASIQYDPNRSANIALLHYADGVKKYILAPVGLGVGDTVISGEGADIKAGNALMLQNIPVGTMVHNIELQPNKGGRRFGSSADGKRRQQSDPSYAQRRNALCIAEVPRDHRSGRQSRTRERQHRESGSYPSHGRQTHRPRRCHEPLRSPARRWRGQIAHRYADTRYALG